MRQRSRIWKLFAAAALLAAASDGPVQAATMTKGPIKRGEYLSMIGGCNDCHSPKLMTPAGPAPDPARMLSGHPATPRSCHQSHQGCSDQVDGWRRPTTI
jgi:mono/diheme cytochrome c family protein